MRRMVWHTAVGLLAAAAALPAQGTAPQPLGTRAGLMAGVNLARIDAEDNDELEENLLGAVAGVYLALGLGNVISVQPELLFSMKGAKGTVEGLDGEENVTGQVRLSYIELPVLLRADVGTAGSSLRPHVYAGPTFAYRVGCDLTLNGGGLNVTEECDDLEEEDDGPRRFDAGVALGGGLGFGVGRQTFIVGARYTLGVTNISTSGADDAKNRVLSIYGAIEFPFGGR